MLLLLCALIPIVFGGTLAFLKNINRKAKMCYVLLTTLVTSAFAGYLAFCDYSMSIELFHLSDAFVCALHLDEAGKCYLCIAELLWPLAALYAAEYMQHEKHEGNFFTWYTMTYGVVILLACSANLFTLYVFYEFLTLITLPLVWHEKDKASIRSARRYMLSLFGGAALGFIALVGLTYLGAGSFRPGGTEIQDRGEWLRWLCLIGFIGFGAKAAILPLSRWLPGASVAPTPVTALLHAVAVVNGGVFTLIRFLYYSVSPLSISGTWVQSIMLSLSVATILLGSVMAVREQHLKKRLAWSTVSNLSYMIFGLSLLSRQGLAAGMGHMVFHSVMKIILFFCTGAVMVQTGRTQVRGVHGLGREMPLTFGMYMFSGIALVGVPPLAGFVGKNYLVLAAFSDGNPLSIIGTAALLVSSVLTAIYIFTVAFPAFFMSRDQKDGDRLYRDPGPAIKTTLICLAALLICISVFAGSIMDYLNGIAGGVFR